VVAVDAARAGARVGDGEPEDVRSRLHVAPRLPRQLVPAGRQHALRAPDRGAARPADPERVRPDGFHQHDRRPVEPEADDGSPAAPGRDRGQQPPVAGVRLRAVRDP
jgi:hypothetical protein